LLAFFWIFNAFFPAQGLIAGKVIVSISLLLAVLMFAVQIVNNLSSTRMLKINLRAKIILFLLFFWSLVTIVRGLTVDVGRLFTLVANPEIGGLVWLLPFALYIGRQPGVLQALIPVLRLHAMIGLPLVIWSIAEVWALNVLPKDSPAKVGLVLLYAAPIVLLTGIGSRRDRWLYVFCLIMAAAAHIVLSNRAGFAMSLGFLIIYFALGKARKNKNIISRLMLFSTLAMPLLYFGSSYILSGLSDDWFTDTRTFLVVELADDFNIDDWIIGRGALGTYFSPYFEYTRAHDLGGDSSVRQVNEIGYLHLILKSGIIGAVLYFITFAYAVFAARKLADDRLSAGIIMLFVIHLLEMLVVGQASMLPYKVMLFILVGVAISRQPDYQYHRTR